MSARYRLTLNECPHGVRSISLDDWAGGTRLTTGKCCGRWDEVQTWSMSPDDLREAARLFEDAADTIGES